MKRSIYYRFEQKVKRGELGKAEMLDDDGNVLVFIGGRVERGTYQKRISRKNIRAEKETPKIKELLAEIDF